MKKDASIITEWMRKGDMPTVLRIEEAVHSWDGWGEKDFMVKLREKNIVGMVSRIVDVVGAFVVYEIREKDLFLLKFEVAPELKSTRVAHVLIEELKRKAKKYKKSLKGVFWEGESIDKFQFFAKEGFKSKLKKNFFLSEQNFVPDGIEFWFDLPQNMAETSNFDDSEPFSEGKHRKT